MIISFRWRPTFDKELIGTFLEWADRFSDAKDDHNIPDVIVVCLGVHYGDDLLFPYRLSNDLLPAFQNLMYAAKNNNNSHNRDLEIVWVNQRPLTNAFHPYTTNNDRMNRYNEAAHRIFK